jgi:uncharacterized protein
VSVRVVFDTNVLISALVFGGAPEALLMAAAAGAFPLFSSPALRGELLEVLEERFAWSDLKLRELERRLDSLWTEVEPGFELTDCSDPDDNRVLECAVECGATHIVTGDAALLVLDPFRGIRIVRTAAFLAERPWSED